MANKVETRSCVCMSGSCHSLCDFEEKRGYIGDAWPSEGKDMQFAGLDRDVTVTDRASWQRAIGVRAVVNEIDTLGASHVNRNRFLASHKVTRSPKPRSERSRASIYGRGANGLTANDQPPAECVNGERRAIVTAPPTSPTSPPELEVHLTRPSLFDTRGIYSWPYSCHELNLPLLFVPCELSDRSGVSASLSLLPPSLRPNGSPCRPPTLPRQQVWTT